MPRYDITHDLATWSVVASPSYAAIETSAVLPVKSSAPVISVMKRPNGRPNAPRMIFCSPGLVAASPGHAAPTVSIRYAPKPMWQPERMPRPKICVGDIPAFALPAATAPV